MKASERNLLDLFRGLDEAQQRSLLDYAGYLAEREAPRKAEVPQPLDIPRPEHESVIKAIKRLRGQYPMLEASRLINVTSEQMTRHMIHGISAEEVIDELEKVFRAHYDALVKNLAAPE